MAVFGFIIFCVLSIQSVNLSLDVGSHSIQRLGFGGIVR